MSDWQCWLAVPLTAISVVLLWAAQIVFWLFAIGIPLMVVAAIVVGIYDHLKEHGWLGAVKNAAVFIGLVVGGLAVMIALSWGTDTYERCHPHSMLTRALHTVFVPKDFQATYKEPKKP